MADPKKAVVPIEEFTERLSKETDAIVAASKKLIEEMELLLERARQLKAAHNVLLDATRATRQRAKDEKTKS